MRLDIYHIWNKYTGRYQPIKIWTERRIKETGSLSGQYDFMPVGDNIERYSFNTSISALMICLNNFYELECISKDVFRDYLLLLKPFALKTVKNIWINLFDDSLEKARFPEYNQYFLKEDNIQYPVMINGKTRTQIEIDINATEENIKNIVLNNDVVCKWIDNKEIKKFIVVKGKAVSIVI